MLLFLQIVISVMGVYLIYRLRRDRAERARACAAEVSAAGLLAKELKETCSAMTRRLEQKQETLERLVEEADARIRLLDQLTARAPQEGNAETGFSIADRYNEVFALYDRGLSLSEIAKRTSMDQGQIQLIFNLKRKI